MECTSWVATRCSNKDFEGHTIIMYGGALVPAAPAFLIRPLTDSEPQRAGSVRLWSQTSESGCCCQVQGRDWRKGGKCLGNAVSEERAVVEEKPINMLGKTNKQKNKPVKRSMTTECIYWNF